MEYQQSDHSSKFLLMLLAVPLAFAMFSWLSPDPEPPNRDEWCAPDDIFQIHDKQMFAELVRLKNAGVVDPEGWRIIEFKARPIGSEYGEWHVNTETKELWFKEFPIATMRSAQATKPSRWDPLVHGPSIHWSCRETTSVYSDMWYYFWLSGRPGVDWTPPDLSYLGLDSSEDR